MNPESNQLEKAFLGKWILVTSIAWPVGIIGSFIVAHIVNIIYPKETNLVVGLCVGAVVGYSQRFVLRKQITVDGWWGLACAIGLGVPFIVVVIFDEVGFKLPDLPSVQLLSRTIIGIIGGLLSGLFQLRLLKPYSTKAGWWILASSIGWGICWLASSIAGPLVALVGLVIGGILLGVITGGCLLWILEFPVQEE